MNTGTKSGQGSWAFAAVLVFGVWLIALVAFLLLSFSTTFEGLHAALQLLAAIVVSLMAPAYGWHLAKAARADGRVRRARGAKVAAIVALVVNCALFVLMLLFIDAVSHMR